ncbi:hypothetical protein A2U01_0094495, partial [Trifolium medium]|nr:hypothetical protein [Trifolium medium]
GKHWSFCHLRAAQERMARRARQLEGCIRKALPLARCAASSGFCCAFPVKIPV